MQVTFNFRRLTKLLEIEGLFSATYCVNFRPYDMASARKYEIAANFNFRFPIMKNGLRGEKFICWHFLGGVRFLKGAFEESNIFLSFFSDSEFFGFDSL